MAAVLQGADGMRVLRREQRAAADAERLSQAAAAEQQRAMAGRQLVAAAVAASPLPVRCGFPLTVAVHDACEEAAPRVLAVAKPGSRQLRLLMPEQPEALQQGQAVALRLIQPHSAASSRQPTVADRHARSEQPLELQQPLAHRSVVVLRLRDGCAALIAACQPQAEPPGRPVRLRRRRLRTENLTEQPLQSRLLRVVEADGA